VWTGARDGEINGFYSVQCTYLYDLGEWINALAVDNNGNLWAAATGAYSFVQNNTNYYNESNSGLFDNNIRSFAFDSQNNLWCGSLHGGLQMFNGNQWVSYNTENSEIPGNWVMDVAVDNNNTIWMTSQHNGLVKFDGQQWTQYNESNSNIPGNYTDYIAIDANNVIWVAGEGLSRFDGTSWTNYNTSNSGLPENTITCLGIDRKGNIWAGTYEHGIAKFNYNTNEWVVYNAANSGLPLNSVTDIAFDASNNKWITTFGGGLSKLISNENTEDIENISQTLKEIRIYPNPVTDLLHVETSNEAQIAVVEVYSIAGVRLMTINPAGYNCVLNMDNWDSGTYLLKIKTANRVFTERFVKSE